MKPTKPISLKSYHPRAKYWDVKDMIQDIVNREAEMIVKDRVQEPPSVSIPPLKWTAASALAFARGMVVKEVSSFLHP